MGRNRNVCPQCQARGSGEDAWRVALDQLFETSWTSIRDATQYTSERFTPEVYREHISGKPTTSGARAALRYFRVLSTDPRTEERARRKQRGMDELLRARELGAYPDALRFVLAVLGAETPRDSASSSKDADRLLSQIRLDAFADREGLRPIHSKAHEGGRMGEVARIA